MYTFICLPGINIDSTAVGKKACGCQAVGDQQLIAAVVFDMLSPGCFLIFQAEMKYFASIVSKTEEVTGHVNDAEQPTRMQIL